MDSQSDLEMLEKFALFLDRQAEKHEILKHKWYESEKAGRDIGFDRALLDWTIKHRKEWRRNKKTTKE